MTRIAILASGEGTTADAFIQACISGDVPAQVVLVICNKPTAGIFTRIERLNQEHNLNIDIELVNGMLYPALPDEIVERGGQSDAEQSMILNLLETYDIELVLLMGYLRRIGPRIVRQYGWRSDYESPFEARMLNTHPGLLPATKGLWGIGVQQHVISEMIAEGGQTLHVVAEDYDDGPIVAEHSVPVEAGDDAEVFFERVKSCEKASLPGDIKKFIHDRESFVKSREK